MDGFAFLPGITDGFCNQAHGVTNNEGNMTNHCQAFSVLEAAEALDQQYEDMIQESYAASPEAREDFLWSVRTLLLDALNRMERFDDTE